MAKTESGNSEKNLISRRTLLSNSLLTGLSIASGFYLTNPSVFPFSTKISGSRNSLNNHLEKSETKLKEKTYIDNFDC
jgi:hypothetical protein